MMILAIEFKEIGSYAELKDTITAEKFEYYRKRKRGFPTRTPTLHDERFHEELSDEFWMLERNYLLF
jgi:hypothetical protein